MRTWIYDPVGLNGGAGGEVFRTIFNGSGFKAAELLAREAIQNSVDATRPGQRPEVTIRARVLAGDALQEFRRAAALEDLARRAPVLGLPEGNALESGQDSLRVLYISDRGTTGLSGDPTNHTSRLRKLLMEIGGSLKMAEGESSGGSFGFGKAVYAGSSRIATIFAYSRTVDHRERPLSVLMGCAYHVQHEFEGRETTGRGFLAVPVPVEGRGTRYDAFTEEEADRLAEALGMQREPEDTGTTIAILDCLLPIEDIRKGIERSWWPRIMRDGFRVELRDETDRKIIPRPKSDPQLRPFMEAMDVTLGKSLPAPPRSKLVSLYSIEGLPPGKLGLVATPGEALDVEDEDDENLEHRSAIAMIRSPGMVVWNYRKGPMGYPPVAGVFVADDKVDAILRRSEPPEHDNWDERASRLLSEAERKLVKAIKDNSWRQFRMFQKSAQPPRSPSSSRISELERLLGKLLGPSALKVPGGEGRHETPVSLKSRISARPEKGALVAKGHVELSLAKKAAPQQVRLTICLRAVDEAGHMRDSIGLSVRSGPPLEWRDDALTGIVALEQGAPLAFEVESLPYDRNWTLTFQPVVTPDDSQAGVLP